FSLDLTCGSSISGQLPKDQEPLRFKDGKKKTIFHYSHRHELGFFKYRKVCGDKIPRTLSHSFHPKHPLRLTYTYENRKCNVCSEKCNTATPLYVCEICSFRLDFDCAKLSPSLKLDCHHHLLTFFKDFNQRGEEGQDSYCKACGKHCDGDKVASGKLPSSSTPPMENKVLFVEQNEGSHVIRTLKMILESIIVIFVRKKEIQMMIYTIVKNVMVKQSLT
ncbi:hypothetical protein Gotur_032608, partial [Gossypium turneri]